jgi:hypothetical protein
MERNTKESGRSELITSKGKSEPRTFPKVSFRVTKSLSIAGDLEVEVRRSMDETSAMELSRRTTHPQSTEESCLIQFDDVDNLNPQNWPLKKKSVSHLLLLQQRTDGNQALYLRTR